MTVGHQSTWMNTDKNTGYVKTTAHPMGKLLCITVEVAEEGIRKNGSTSLAIMRLSNDQSPSV
jgi:hypothetical protein